MSKLPNDLIELGRLCLADLRKVEGLPEIYEVNMSKWHEPADKCLVCAAGSVMAMTLGADRYRYLEPSGFFYSRRKLIAINSLRKGNAVVAWMRLDDEPGRYPYQTRYFSITRYEIDREAFHHDMNAMLNQLEDESHAIS